MTELQREYDERPRRRWRRRSPRREDVRAARARVVSWSATARRSKPGPRLKLGEIVVLDVEGRTVSGGASASPNSAAR